MKKGVMKMKRGVSTNHGDISYSWGKNKCSWFIVTPHAARTGLSDRCSCPYIYMFVDKKNCKRTLAIDLSFTNINSRNSHLLLD